MNRKLDTEINVEFQEASSRQELQSGEKINTLFGKIKKWLSSLKTVAFSGDYNDLSNKPDLDAKIDKVAGKGLSTEDFTTAEKNKLSGIEAGAQVNTITGVKGNAESSYRAGNVNITPDNIGAAASSHTHNYAGSSTPGGAANSAVKLQTARTISLNGGFQGETSFDGAADVFLNGSLKRCIQRDDSGDFNSYSWHKFAEIVSNDVFYDYSIFFLVSKTWGTVSETSGILVAHFRTSNIKKFSSGEFRWLIAGSGINPNNFVMVYSNVPNAGVKVELWHAQTKQYDGWSFTVLNEHQIQKFDSSWTLFSATGHGSPNYTAGEGTIVSSFATLINPVASTAAISSYKE